MCQDTIYQSPLLSPGSQNGKTSPDQDHGAHPLVYESPLHHGLFYPDCWIIFSIHGCVFHGVHWWQHCSLGKGIWPETDAWGEPFGACSPQHWKEKAGKPICGPFRAVVDGFHGDQEFLHKLFEFKRSLVAHMYFYYIYIYVRVFCMSVIFAKLRPSSATGSWHSKRRKCCPFCEAWCNIASFRQ